ncbi:hypothetical protein MKEN_01157900 [Mycena kentingensis (nom. inval.)]|nr:hypothetical protein MKEN_01157900 [Mycena kentingensis (nom. inval.)]
MKRFIGRARLVYNATPPSSPLPSPRYVPQPFVNKIDITPPKEPSAQSLFPVELWLLIIDCIAEDSDAGRSLLRMAGVCSLLNTLCMEEFFARHTSSASMTWTDDKAELMTGPLGLAALQMALDLPKDASRLQRLACRFQKLATFSAELTLLNDLLPRLPHLTQLSFNLGFDISSTMETTPPFDVLDMCCTILAQMATRTHGPIILVAKEGVFLRRNNRGDFIRYLARVRPQRKNWSSSPTDRSFGVLSALVCAKIVLVPPQATLRGGFALVLLDADSISSLELGEDGSSGWNVPTEYINLALPHLHLPRLKELRLNTDDLRVSALQDFIERHKTLESMVFQPRAKQYYTFLTKHVAIELPKLQRIAARDLESLDAVLYSLGASRTLRRVEVEFDVSSISAGALLPVLCLLAERPYNRAWRMHLEFTIDSLPGTRRSSDAVDPDLAQTARELRCVKSVKLRASKPTDFYHLLPCLTLLPELEEVVFVLLNRVPTPPTPEMGPAESSSDSEVADWALNAFLVDARSFFVGVRVRGRVEEGAGTR